MNYKIDEVLLHGTEDDIFDYLSAPENAVIVDWREGDDIIVEYFSETVDENLIARFDLNDNLVIRYGGRHITVKLQQDEDDRYRTIRAIRDMIAHKYEIRVFAESLESDTHSFYVKPIKWWQWADEHYGDRLDEIFVPLTDDINFE